MRPVAVSFIQEVAIPFSISNHRPMFISDGQGNYRVFPNRGNWTKISKWILEDTELVQVSECDYLRCKELVRLII